jgi:hypothetical protein
MGSPENEAGRWGDESSFNEGPCHDATLTSGFWLFDTSCTQTFWEAVMESNPSHFVSPNRPVDSVSWDDTQEFLDRLNGSVADLNLTLPTEAQWEYACRAGTTAVTWLGALEILGEKNAPLLDEIAWYGGNSGVEFELPKGYDSSDWPEKQYDHTNAGTRLGRLRSLRSRGLAVLVRTGLPERQYRVPLCSRSGSRAVSSGGVGRVGAQCGAPRRPAHTVASVLQVERGGGSHSSPHAAATHAVVRPSTAAATQISSGAI